MDKILDSNIVSSSEALPQYSIPFDEKYEININYFHTANGNHLFNEPEYFNIHTNSPNDIYAQLVRQSDAKVFLTIAIYEIDTNIFSSPKHGTYGGLSLNEKIRFAKVEKFMSSLSDFLKLKGGRALRIRCAPASHDLAWFSIMFNVLKRQGYILDAHEINFDLVVDKRSFIERIDYGNVKRIRKSIKNQFICEKTDHERFDEVYEVIKDSRERLGVSVSMSFSQLKKMLTLFPEKIHLFSVYRDSTKSSMVASAVCMTLTNSIMYVFYWGDRADVSTYSPIALLASKIYEFCQENGIIVLDVGISTIGSEPNYGLMQFKHNLGFSESLKADYSLKLK
jgi:hypothetical protein